MTPHRLGLEGWPRAATTRLLDLCADLACVVGFDGRLQEVTGDWTALLGWRPADMRTHLLGGFVHPDDAATTESALQEARAGGDAVQFDNRFRTADGSTRWLSWTVVAVPDEGVYRAVVRDATARYAAEADVHESQRRYLDIIDSAHDIVQSILPDAHFEFVNRAWHDNLGYTPQQLPDLTLFDIVAEADHDHCTLMIGQIMSGQSFDHVEITFVRRDGTSFPVEGNATGRFRDGVFVATHTFFRDVSDRRRAEALQAEYQHHLEEEVATRTAALVQSEKLATLGRLSAGMAHELNNPAAAAQRGAALLGDAFTRTSTALLTVAAAAPHAEEVARLGALIRPDAVPGIRRLTPLERSDREEAIAVWLDEHGLGDAWEATASLTDRGWSDAELDAVAQQFAADLLPAVLATVSAADDARTLIAQIGSGAARMSQIVAALKDYSYMDRAPIQDVDVHAGLDSTLIMLQSKLTHGVDVHRDYGPDVPHIEALGSELNQVWTNLIDNALDAMGGSGTLTVHTRRDGDGVTVEIEDDGPGIPDDILGTVFEPFFTTKPLGHGTGLGLNIVRNMIRGSGGRIDVQSAPGHTVFRVWLPPRLPDASADAGGRA